MGKEDGKLKSSRRNPLRDVSNGGVKVKSLKSAIMKKKKKEEEMSQPQDDLINHDPLDRLLFLHSDISSILRQIDELVVQAVNVKTTDSKRSKDIKSFADLLSEINTSLKPWAPKLQKALASCSTEPNTQSVETCGGAHSVIDDDDTVGTPELSKHESLVSPSPLVSWRVTECTIERGKQLFLLTPLPRPRTVMSKAPLSKLRAREEITFTSTAPVSFPGVKAVAKNAERATETDSAAFSPNIPIGDFSLLVTPSLKNPPKSCMLLEPECVFMNRKIDESQKATLINKVYESTDSKNSGNEISENLSLKYPELIGIKPSCMLKSGIKTLEASPAWMMSPPKCCTLLEPPDEKPVKDDASLLDCHLQELNGTFNEQICLNDQVHDNKNISFQGKFRGTIVRVENTPLWKACKSTVYKGRRPGENTLKKELWTKFEAASTSEFRLNLCDFQDASEKRFLDRLEEASCEETGSYPDSLR